MIETYTLYYREGDGQQVNGYYTRFTPRFEVNRFRSLDEMQAHMNQWNNFHAVWEFETVK